MYNPKYPVYNAVYMKTAAEIHTQNVERFRRRLGKYKVFRTTWDELVKEAWEHQNDLDNPQFCWIWASTLQKGKYPIFPIVDVVTRKEKTAYARRFAFLAVFNHELQHDEWVGMYRCGETKCVNPFHASTTKRDDWIINWDKVTREIKQRRDINDPLAAEKRANEVKKA